MSLFEAENVYRVVDAEAGAYVHLSDSEVELDSAEIIDCEDDIFRPLHVTGIQEDDLVVAGTFIYEDEYGELAGKDVSFFVTHYSKQAGVIVPGDMLDNDPRRWLSPRLSYLLQGLEPEELQQFTVPGIMRYIESRKNI